MGWGDEPRMAKGRTVALVSGFWGQNVGNAFFNVGGKWILQQVFPESHVEFIQDQPGYRTFHRKSSGNPKRDLVLLKHLKCDYLVLQGPMLMTAFRPLWEESFAALRERGTKIILLSAALLTYTEEEIVACREFLAQYPPAIMVTRDRVTYEVFKDICEWVYDGIDSAFFAPKAVRPFELALDPYITVNFDRYPEPRFYVAENPSNLPKDCDGRFEALDYHWGFRSPRVQSWFSGLGQWQAYIGAMVDFRRLPDRLGPFVVVRPEHRTNPHVGWKIYRQPNAVASDEPYTYLSLYAGTSLTLSDRVHACVATVAYGKPAMLFAPTPRSALFERLGLGEILTHPVSLPYDVVEGERQAELEFLRRAVAALE